jgi:hypothetical protein
MNFTEVSGFFALLLGTYQLQVHVFPPNQQGGREGDTSDCLGERERGKEREREREREREKRGAREMPKVHNGFGDSPGLAFIGLRRAPCPGLVWINHYSNVVAVLIASVT